MKRYFILIWGMTVILCSGCGGRSTDPQKTIYLRLNENPLTLDPSMMVDLTSGEVGSKLFSGLVKYDQATSSLVGDLAESFKVNLNGTEFTFKLKPSLFFSDGTPVTAEDVLFSWKRVLSKKTGSPRAWVFEKIKGAQDFKEGKKENWDGFILLDHLSFKIVMDEPYTQFLSLLTMPAASVLSQKSFSEYMEGRTRVPVSAGPYQLNYWKADVQIHLIPNPHYFDSKRVHQDLVYKIVPDDASAITMISTGELDILKTPRQHTTHLKETLKDYSFLSIQELNTYYIGFDHRKSFIDIFFKRAVSFLIDKKALMNTVMNQQAVEALTPVPPVLFSPQNYIKPLEFSESAAKNCYQKSPAKGKKILFLVPSVKETELAATVIQDQMKKIGIPVEIKIMDWSAFKEAIAKGEADMFLMSWWADYADPENFLYPTFHSKNFGIAGNRVYYSNRSLDTFLDYLHVYPQEEKRNMTIQKSLVLLNVDLPWIPLWHRTSTYAISPRIKGFSPASLYSSEKGLDWEIKK